MSERNAELLLADMLESAAKIEEYTSGMNYESFIQDSKTVDAVVRNFEIIGEAAGRMPEDFKDAHAQIDWHRIRDSEIELFTIISVLILVSFGKSKETFLPDLVQQLKSINS
jgi:uncharacterized protein with HEPN domain